MKYLSFISYSALLGIQLLFSSQVSAVTSVVIQDPMIDQQYILENKQRVTRTRFDFSYRVQLNNSDAAIKNVTATVTSSSENTTIIEGSVSFSDVSAGAFSESIDTFTLRQDRRHPFDPSVLVWNVQYELVDDGSSGIESDVSLRVISTTGEIVPEYTLSVDSEVLEVEKVAGVSTLTSLEEDTVVTLQITHPNFANQVVPVKVPINGEKLVLDVVLIPRAQTQTILLDSPIEVSGTDGAKVSVSPSMFVDQQGNAITDNIEVTITPVDVSTPVGIAAFPGEFAGIAEQGQAAPTPIISYGTVEYKFTKNGEEIQLAPGEQAEIEIPIYVTEHQNGSAIVIGNEIPLWSLNEDTGIWLQEGTGTVVASSESPTNLALSATVSHFSWWNCDVIMNPALAIVTVNAPKAGTALIKARTIGDIGWSSNTVDTIIAVGLSTEPLAIPNDSEVCFWAEISFINGEYAATSESCITATLNNIVNVNLEVLEGELNLTATPNANVTAYINLAPAEIKIQPITAETGVTYIIETGKLPTGVVLSAVNDRIVAIIGAPTETGIFNPVIKGTDVDGNIFTLPLKYTVIDGDEPPRFVPGTIINSPLKFYPNPFEQPRSITAFANIGEFESIHDLKIANVGGEATNWAISFIEAKVGRKISIGSFGYIATEYIEDIPSSAIDISMDSEAGILIVNWPESYLDKINAFDKKVIDLYLTLSASNSTGSSSIELYLWNQNDGFSVTYSFCQDRFRSEGDNYLNYLYSYLQGFSTGFSTDEGTILANAEIIAEIENEIREVQSCILHWNS